MNSFCMIASSLSISLLLQNLAVASRLSLSSFLIHHRTSINCFGTQRAVAFIPSRNFHLSPSRVTLVGEPCHRKMSTAPNKNSEGVGLTDVGKSNRSKTEESNAVMDWKSRIDISIAKSRKIRGSNYVQIATVDHETMEPRCRTVVFRGFMKDVPLKDSSAYGNRVMKMITDLRSSKVKEIESFGETGNSGGSNVEMVWWFPKSSEQYRIRGKLQFIGSDGPLNSNNVLSEDVSTNKEYFSSERKQQWGNLSDMAREQFYWEDPGISYTSTWANGEGVPTGGRDDEGKVLPPPDTFLLMLLYPLATDYLRLGDNFRRVDKWEDGSWTSKRVNP